MIEQDIVDAFSNKLAANINDIRKMSPSQLDRVKSLGTAAENLLVNRDFVLFVRQHQLEIMDALVEIKGHAEENNSQRVALTNQLVGLDSFIALLKRAKYIKTRVVTLQEQPAEPDTI